MLTIVDGPCQGRTVSIARGEQLIAGRSADSDFAVMDPRMSRAHFRLDCDKQHCRLYDLASSNGTTVNGQPVDDISLQAGDLIVAGDTQFQVHLVGDEDGNNRHS